MTRLDLSAVEAIVNLLAKKIAASEEELPTFGVSEQSGRHHVEISHVYHYVVEERGQESFRRITVEFDLLLYWIFESVTALQARRIKLKNSKTGDDHRRFVFAKQEELLGLLSASWQIKARSEHGYLLIMHPSSDDVDPASPKAADT